MNVLKLVSSASMLSIISEPNAGQIQEGIGEAVNNIVKHFHKPEKEVLPTLHYLPGHYNVCKYFYK